MEKLTKDQIELNRKKYYIVSKKMNPPKTLGSMYASNQAKQPTRQARG